MHNIVETAEMEAGVIMTISNVARNYQSSTARASSNRVSRGLLKVSPFMQSL